MSSSHLQEVFLRHTCDACICRMASQRQIGLAQPVVQGLGMNPKHSCTRCYRKNRHDQDSFRRRTKEETRPTTDPGNFPELCYFQEISWKSGVPVRWIPDTGGEKGEEARFSRRTFDVCYGKSWHDFGESWATTTRPAPGTRTREAGQISRASRWRTSGMVRGSRRCRAGMEDREVAGGEVQLQAVAQIPARYASANKTSVTCRYQPMKLRTS
jgi:hypothetical protein